MSTTESNRLSHGRTNQKLRTRLALLQGARELMERGEPVSVTAAAKQSGISVATAYRYFSDPDALASEAILDLDLAKSGNLMAEVSGALSGIDDVEARVLTVHRILFAFTRRVEMPYRLFLAKTLEAHVKAGGKPKTIARGGRRLPMLELALAPVSDKLSSTAFHDLICALSVGSGIEVFLVLKDICGLADPDIDRIAERNLLAILRAHLPERDGA
jgi:AcrR family transcriptional regulator